MTAKLGSEEGVTRPVTVTVPATLAPSAGVKKVTLAGSSGRVVLVVANSLVVPVLALTSHQIS